MTGTAPLIEEVGIALDAFVEKMGITDVTAWRWRKKNVLKTTNIFGRQYIMPEDLREFNRRAKAGEFAKEHIAPKKTKKLDSEKSESSLVE